MQPSRSSPRPHQIEQLTLVILRMAEKIAGRPLPDTTVLRAIKTVMSEAVPPPSRPRPWHHVLR